MQQVADWLEKLGLGQYAKRFAENDIDFALLTKLTDANLKELGVTSLGHRMRLLEAIGERAVASGAATLAEPKVQDTAERRQVTVVFSDLVGSTALSARMDPEDLREVISAYQKCVAQVAQRFGGFVAKYMGDGVLVYFGYPQAHEDDAERAVRAGLELIRPLRSGFGRTLAGRANGRCTRRHGRCGFAKNGSDGFVRGLPYERTLFRDTLGSCVPPRAFRGLYPSWLFYPGDPVRSAC